MKVDSGSSWNNRNDTDASQKWEKLENVKIGIASMRKKLKRQAANTFPLWDVPLSDSVVQSAVFGFYLVKLVAPQ